MVLSTDRDWTMYFYIFCVHTIRYPDICHLCLAIYTVSRSSSLSPIVSTMTRITPLSFLLLGCVTSLVSGMASTTTSAPAQPGPDASLDEVWSWMSSVAQSQDQGAVTINMWMSGNKMSMQASYKYIYGWTQYM